MLRGATKAAKTPKLNEAWSMFAQGSSTTSSFQWLKPIQGTCLHGVHKDPIPMSKVALFDLDGTLVRPKSGKKHPADGDDWTWWDAKVKPRLNQVVEDGFSVIIITNQGGLNLSVKSHKRTVEWKRKIPQIAANLPNVPFRLFAATDYDQFRKPLPGIWNELTRIYSEAGVTIDKESSFFVGDAAGRAEDHSSADRLFAMNVGIPFQTPEQYFLNRDPKPFTISSWDPAALLNDVPLFSPSITPLVPDASTPELVLFVGYPSIGKSTFYKKHFAPKGYVHVNQDTLKSVSKCLALVRESAKKGKSCVVDNTNRNVKTRQAYVEMAKQLKIPIRCLTFSASLELAKHNNTYRAFFEPPKDGEKRRDLLPVFVLDSFKSAYEAPELSEGFDEIKTINFIFEGTEEERQLWNFRMD